MTIYDRIDDLLKSMKKSRKDLCSDTHISYSTLTSMFQRKSDSISIKSLILIADYLDVTTDYLLKGDLSFNNVEDYMLNEVSTIYAELPLPKKVKLLDNAITLKKEAKSDE